MKIRIGITLNEAIADAAGPQELLEFIELCERSEEMTRAALGVDSRGREFLDELPRALEEVRKSGHRVEVIFLDASDDALVRRFSETRRPHPLSTGSDVAAAIARERESLAWLREHADRILDTSAYTGHELRAAVHALFSSGSDGRYEVQGLQLAAYTVRIEAKGYAPFEGRVTIDADGETVDAVLQKGGAHLF